VVDLSRTVHDPDVPALELLLGHSAPRVLDAVVAPVGGSVRSARVRQVRYVPTKSVTAQYDAELEVGDARTRSTLIVSSGISVPGEVVRLEAGGIEIAAWAYPHDPFLPGLSLATDSHRVGELLEDMGAASSVVRLRQRAYRAGRRAVIEVESGSASIYLKIVRPSRVGALQEIHRLMVRRVPAPHSLGWSKDLGVVALEGRPGRPLRKAILDDSAALPGVAPLVELLDRLPAMQRKAAAGSVARVPGHVRLLSMIMPDLSDRLEAIAQRVSAAPTERVTPAHGDFHAGQVLVDGGRVTGLVDVDTAGMGNRVDDLAGLLAQLSTLALTAPHRARLDGYGASLIAGFEQLVDSGGLRLRVAAAVLGFATGPFRVQMADWRAATVERVELAERWVQSAATAR
jgi:hypothetical protein